MADKRSAALQAVRKLDVLWNCIPMSERGNPARLASWLRSAFLIGGLPPHEYAALAQAQEAVTQWREAENLQSELAALYNDPAIRKAAESTGRDIDYYFSHPSEAPKAL